MADPFIGQILAVGFNYAPQGWALCNGQLLQVNQYQALFTLLGAAYGGDGHTTFGLPDLRSRVPVGFGQGPSLPTYSMGQSGGAANVTLLAANLPPHTHPVAPPVSNVAATASSPVNAYPAVDTATDSDRAATVTVKSYATASVVGQTAAAYATGSSGNSTPVSINPPFQVVNYIIATLGIFPARS